MAVDTPSFVSASMGALFVLAVECGNFIAQEFSSLTPRMSDQRLFFGEVEFKFFPEKNLELLLNGFGLFVGAEEGETEIIGRSYVFEASVVWVVRIL
jgi:hypothetical protein